MPEPQFESALQHQPAPTGTYISLREITTRGMIDLRANSTPEFMAAVKSILALDIPKAPRRSQGFGNVKALWLSPDQWLIQCARENAPSFAEELQGALAGQHALVVDVSDMRSIIRLEGEVVREVMMKVTSLDFTNTDFTPGYVRRVRFGESAALFNIVETHVIDVYVFRSYAEYAWDFLLKAARKGSEVGPFRLSGLQLFPPVK